jgi:GxxExxY protein
MEKSQNTLINMSKQVGEDIGKGYTENIYQEAICVLLRNQNLNYSKEVVMPKYYNNCFIGNIRADIIVNNNFVIECKAVEGELRDSHLPQIITYMEILQIKNGLFINFNQNPSKEFVEIYKVIKDHINGNYLFDNNNCKKFFTNKGKKIENKISNDDILNFIKIHISESTDNILYKNKCKELFDSHFQDYPKSLLNFFISQIEILCNQTFKDKQINGKKYTNIIMNYKLI